MKTKKRWSKKEPLGVKQKGGFPTYQLHTTVTENPMFSYASSTHKPLTNIDRMYSQSHFIEVPKSFEDDLDTVDAWLAQIVYFGKIKKENEFHVPSLTKVIEVRNSKK